MPVMGTNEIWRVSLEGGTPEIIASDLGVPDAVKFDPAGNIVSTQVASGQVLRIDPRTGERTVLADIAPGLDNLAFVGDRLFVSSISGQINEIVAPGQVRSLLPDGFNWPLDLAVDDDGVLFIADGPYCYTLQSGGAPQVAGMLFTPGCPGYIRGVAAAGRGEMIVTTANGVVARYQPASQSHQVLASGFDQLYGVALAPADTVIFAELGTGRVLSACAGRIETLASGLQRPMGVALGADGTCLVSESGAGRVARLHRGGVDTVLDGLQQPQGIFVRNDLLYVVDTGAKELIECDLRSGVRRTIASALPVGAPAGVVPKFLGAIGDMSGPMGPFAGITGTADGTLYLSGDADGSILALHPGKR
jgi:sugar lactone lactonase YvrE